MVISGNQQFLRNLNRLAVLRCVRLNPGISRVKLADTLGLTRPTIGNLVDDLLEQSWLSETKLGPTGALGRRPVALSLDSSRNALIGADINNQHVICVATNLAGDILESSITPIQLSEAGAVLDALASQTSKLSKRLRNAGFRIAAMGVGVPGPVDQATGVLHYSDSTGWKKLPVRSLLQERLSQAGVPAFPLIVQRAVGCVALYHFESVPHAEEETLVYVHIGHSITCAIASRYTLLQGHSGMAGAIGHVVMDPAGPLCSCGKRGCANTLVTIRAVESATGLSAAEVFGSTHSTSPLIVNALELAGRRFAEALHNVCLQFDPGRVFVGGAMIQASPIFLAAARAQLSKMYEGSGFKAPLIETAPDENKAVALGAATGALYALVRPVG